MSVYHLPFLFHREFAMLRRPDKLLLIGLYHQWVNNNCLPLPICQTDLNMLRDLSGIEDLQLQPFNARRWQRMSQCGLLLTNDAFTFVTNPANNLAVNLTKKNPIDKNNHTEKGGNQDQKTPTSVQKMDKTVQKMDKTVQKTNRSVQKVNQSVQKMNNKKTNQVSLKSKKPRLHPNFLARISQKPDTDKNVKK